MKTRPISKTVLTLVNVLSIISIAMAIFCSIPVFIFSPIFGIISVTLGVAIPIIFLLATQMIKDCLYHIELQTSILENMLEDDRK